MVIWRKVRVDSIPQMDANSIMKTLGKGSRNVYILWKEKHLEHELVVAWGGHTGQSKNGRKHKGAVSRNV